MDCNIFPVKRKELVTILQVSQIPGWQISALKVSETWKKTKGEGVTVAVIDTGCDLDHCDLRDNLLEGYNVLSPKQKPEDDNDHGTSVTGCICAIDNGHGVIGVAPRCKVVPIKVLDASGCGDMKDVAKGIRVATERKVDMMCVSIGSGRPLASLRKAIKAAAAQGIPIFCAGGNIRKDMDALYPARYPETIAIGAMTKDFTRADFSNTAKHNIDFLAPGVDIVSTVRNDWYAVFSGSSMATPFAVGVVALMVSARKRRFDSVEDYRSALREHGVDLSKFKGDRIFAGYGIIEPKKLIDWAS